LSLAPRPRSRKPEGHPPSALAVQRVWGITRVFLLAFLTATFPQNLIAADCQIVRGLLDGCLKKASDPLACEPLRKGYDDCLDRLRNPEPVRPDEIIEGFNRNQMCNQLADSDKKADCFLGSDSPLAPASPPLAPATPPRPATAAPPLAPATPPRPATAAPPTSPAPSFDTCMGVVPFRGSKFHCNDTSGGGGWLSDE
jgi:hypothetical protein